MITLLKKTIMNSLDRRKISGRPCGLSMHNSETTAADPPYCSFSKSSPPKKIESRAGSLIIKRPGPKRSFRNSVAASLKASQQSIKKMFKYYYCISMVVSSASTLRVSVCFTSLLHHIVSLTNKTKTNNINLPSFYLYLQRTTIQTCSYTVISCLQTVLSPQCRDTLVILRVA